MTQSLRSVLHVAAGVVGIASTNAAVYSTIIKNTVCVTHLYLY